MKARDDIYRKVIASFDPEHVIRHHKLPQARHNTGGRSTGLIQAVWFQSVFELNERNHVLGLYNQIYSERVIQANWLREYEGNGLHAKTGQRIGGSILSGKFSINSYRQKFRRGNLYYNQRRPILFPFKYCSQGYPCKERTKACIGLTLEDCRKMCMDSKIVDPRFFSTQEIQQIKSYAKSHNQIPQWSIPSKTEWEELDKQVPGGIYGRYRLYDKPYDSTEWSPLTW